MPLHESYQVITPGLGEGRTNAGHAFRLHQLHYETHCTIEHVVYDPADDQIRPATRHGGGVTLTWSELISLIQELEPLLNDYHDCARCDNLAPPGHELCPVCEHEDTRVSPPQDDPCQTKTY